MLLLSALAFVATVVAATPGLEAKLKLQTFPEEIILNAPFSAFVNDSVVLTLNVDVIPAMAAQAKGYGVNTIWSCGSMGQFDTMTISERILFNQAWITAAHEQGLFAIAQIGTTVQIDAITLAQQAVLAGADAIATVPPYYEIPSSVDALIAWMQPIAAAAPHLPLFYYHIPGTTHVNIQVYDLLTAAKTALPQLLGVKFVSPDMNDWFLTVNEFNNTHALLFAPEPKLQGFGLGLGRGAILAEDFYAPTYLRMKALYLAGEFAEAIKEQQWKYSVMNVFSKYGGGLAERFAYRWMASKADLGPERAPAVNPAESSFAGLQGELEALGFFNQTAPY
eukprot:m.920445 g.920445  ORF g.920445 m.920445 type:complete len:336 (+) comp65104_c0_seq1:35-1042(+)